MRTIKKHWLQKKIHTYLEKILFASKETGNKKMMQSKVIS